MIRDEQLLWYYYEDGLSDREREQISGALQTDELLAARYRELVSDLEALLPESGTTAPETSKHSWHRLIEDMAAEPSPGQRESRRFAPWIWSAGLAAAVVLGVGIGIQLEPPPEPGVADSTPIASAADDGTFRRGLQLHVQGASLQLASLSDLPESRQSELIDELVTQNRLFARAAEMNDAPELARLLRAFESVLLQLRDTEQAPRDADSLQRQLQFEFRAMLTQMERAPSKQA